MRSKTGNKDKRLRQGTKNGAWWPGYSLKQYFKSNCATIPTIYVHK